MTAPVVLGAHRINADVAGLTSAAARPPSTAGVTPAEVLHPAMEADPGLAGLLAGGIHPEAVAAAPITAVTKATDSVRGRLGGLTPNATGTQAPGPAGGAAAATHAAEARTVEVRRAAGTTAQRLFTNLRGAFQRAQPAPTPATHLPGLDLYAPGTTGVVPGERSTGS